VPHRQAVVARNLQAGRGDQVSRVARSGTAARVSRPAHRLASLAALLVGAASVASCASVQTHARTREGGDGAGRVPASSGDADTTASGVPQPERAARHHFVGTAMGCRVEITIDDDDADRARDAARAAQLELDRLDGMLSDWKRSSELSALNASRTLRHPASAELREVLQRALEVARATDGRFDPTVAPMVAMWRELRKDGQLPAAAALAIAKRRVGHTKVHLEGSDVVRDRTDIALDFGGIGKGYGAVKALEILREAGCPRALVAVAGDIAAGDAPRGERGWTVTIAAEPSVGPSSGPPPAPPSGSSSARADGAVPGVHAKADGAADGAADETLVIARQAVSTSGGSMQWVEIAGVRYAHIVDPRTGVGATRLAQVTVVGPLDCAVDALGTGLALCEDDGEIRTVLARFNGYRARVERDGAAVWIP